MDQRLGRLAIFGNERRLRQHFCTRVMLSIVLDLAQHPHDVHHLLTVLIQSFLGTLHDIQGSP